MDRVNASRDEAYDQFEQVEPGDAAYDQEQEPAPVAEADTPDRAGADLTGGHSGDRPDAAEDDLQRVPAGVGSPLVGGLATGPEHRVLDLTAVERAAERSGLG